MKEIILIISALILDNGLVLDRASDKNTVSIAATGLTHYAIQDTIGLTDNEYNRAKLGFCNTISYKGPGNWLPHFTNPDGSPKEFSEYSTVDTAIFLQSYYAIATQKKDLLFIQELEQYIKSLDCESLSRDGLITHGFYAINNELSMISHKWELMDDGQILYYMLKRFHNLEKRIDLPLFCYTTPFIFHQDKEQYELIQKAIKYQRDTYGRVGMTASDGPNGYTTHIQSPILMWAMSDLLQKTDFEEQFDYKLNSQDAKWVSKDHIAIDYAGAILFKNQLRKYQDNYVNNKKR